MPSRFLSPLTALLRDSLVLTWEVFKIIIPVTLAVEALAYFGLIDVLGAALDPVMGLVGLPGTMGLVVATTMLTHPYAGMAAFVSLAATHPVTMAQASVLAAIMLLSHSLPVETRVMQKVGARLLPMITLRVVAAFVYGWILHQIYANTGALSEPVAIHWAPEQTTPGLMGWLESQIITLAAVFAILVALLVFMRLIEWLRIKDHLERLIAPLLKLMGIGPSVASIAIIGALLGVVYGGAMIVQETKTKPLPARDVYGTLVFMALAHGLIEDTALMLLIGGDIWAILWGRLAFAIVATLIIIKTIDVLPQHIFPRFFKPRREAA